MIVLESLTQDHSYGIANLYQFLGYLLINSEKDAQSIIRAREYLLKAKTIYENLPFFNEEILKNCIRADWLRSISYKLLEDYNNAYEVCNSSLNEVELEKIISPRFSMKLPFLREMALLERSKDRFSYLRQKSDSYSDDDVETFFTYRRIFENCLYSNDMKRADQFYPFVKNAYKAVHSKIDQVYIYSYYKNLYHYFSLKQQHDVAQRIYNLTLKKTKELKLIGQYNELRFLKRIMDQE